jgi:hypothetical protein
VLKLVNAMQSSFGKPCQCDLFGFPKKETTGENNFLGDKISDHVAHSPGQKFVLGFRE